MTLKSLEASIRVYGKLEVWNYPKKGGVTHRMTETQINILNISANEEQKKNVLSFI